MVKFALIYSLALFSALVSAAPTVHHLIDGGDTASGPQSNDNSLGGRELHFNPYIDPGPCKLLNNYCQQEQFQF